MLAHPIDLCLRGAVDFASVIVAVRESFDLWVRRLQHSLGEGNQELFLLVDIVCASVFGQFEVVTHRQCTSRAGLDAVTAENAT